MLCFYTGSKQKHAFPFPPNKYSMFVSMIFSIIIIKEAWASIEKKEKKMRGHILVHSRAKKQALLSNKGWRKNHCYGVIMLNPTSTHIAHLDLSV
jgi:hypothetical protein